MVPFVNAVAGKMLNGRGNPFVLHGFYIIYTHIFNPVRVGAEGSDITNRITEIDIQIAAAIYAGIIVDTGGFKYASTSRSTMEIAARLMDTGIPFTDIYSEVMHSHSFAAVKAFGLALGASKQAIDGRIIYACMTREMIASVGAESSDMDSVVEYLMNTRGAEVALFLYERHQNNKAAGECEADANKDAGESPHDDTQRKIKVSMRSRGRHDVGRIAVSLGGGGHRGAAGCTLVGTMDGVLQRVLGVFEGEMQ